MVTTAVKLIKQQANITQRVVFHAGGLLLFLIVKAYLTYSFVRITRISCDAGNHNCVIVQKDGDCAESPTMKLLL